MKEVDTQLLFKTLNGGWTQFFINCGVVILFVIGLAANDAKAQGEREFDAFETINMDFRISYQEARKQLLIDIYPVIMLMGDDLVLVKEDLRDTQRVVPRVYHELKSIAHVPFAIYLKLIYSTDQTLSKTQVRDLRNYCDLIDASMKQLSVSQLSEEQVSTQSEILKEAKSFLKKVIRESKTGHSDLVDFTHRSRMHFEKNIEDATRAQLMEMYKVVDAWYETFSSEEKSNLRIIISGHKEPRIKSLATQFFSWYLRVPGEGDIICYTEGVTDEVGMFNTIGNHLLSKQAAKDIFLNPSRLHEDLLGIAAEKCLREMQFDLSN
jgi:hypothetical protein